MISPRNRISNEAAIVDSLESSAATVARQSRGTITSGVYVPGEHKVTKERAVASALESSPDLYAAYRAAHNAAPIIRQLQDAGIELRQG